MGSPVDRHQVHARWLRFSKQPRLDLLVMPGVIANILVAILAAMLLVAATGDFRSRTIPNWLNASIALSAIPFWWMTGLARWPEVAVQVAVPAAVLLLFGIGRASCRERVVQYASISVVAVLLNKKNQCSRGI